MLTRVCRMSQRPRDREIPEEHRAQEHLANERTFLAWVRTTIALISLGFVLTRLGPWLSEAGTSRALSRASPIGIGLIVQIGRASCRERGEGAGGGVRL